MNFCCYILMSLRWATDTSRGKNRLLYCGSTTDEHIIVNYQLQLLLLTAVQRLEAHVPRPVVDAAADPVCHH